MTENPNSVIRKPKPASFVIRSIKLRKHFDKIFRGGNVRAKAELQKVRAFHDQLNLSAVVGNCDDFKASIIFNSSEMIAHDTNTTYFINNVSAVAFHLSSTVATFCF